MSNDRKYGKDAPAFPCESSLHGKPYEGLSKREYIIGQVAAGYVPLFASPYVFMPTTEEMAGRIIKLADEIIKQMNQ